MQQRLVLSDYLFTLLLILALTFSAAYYLRQWVLSVQVETSTQIQRAGRIY